MYLEKKNRLMYSYNTAEVKFKSKISSVEIYNYTIITPLACFAPGKHLWKKKPL